MARLLAQELGFEYLDTGAMYRAATLGALRHGVDWNQPEQLAQVVRGLQIHWANQRIYLDGQDVTDQIRSPELTALVHHVADNPQVRQWMVELQRRIGQGRNLVTEGRDQGTVVFPQAEVKFFLTASPEVRAQRRQEQLRQKGVEVPLEQILREQQQRDRRDSTRSVGPLVPAPDAIVINTDHMTVEQVVELLKQHIRSRTAPPSSA